MHAGEKPSEDDSNRTDDASADKTSVNKNYGKPRFLSYLFLVWRCSLLTYFHCKHVRKKARSNCLNGHPKRIMLYINIYEIKIWKIYNSFLKLKEWIFIISIALNNILFFIRTYLYMLILIILLYELYRVISSNTTEDLKKVRFLVSSRNEILEWTHRHIKFPMFVHKFDLLTTTIDFHYNKYLKSNISSQAYPYTLHVSIKQFL